MANNPQFTGIQPPRPPIAPLGPPQTALPSMPMQYRPVVPPQQPQPYMPVASQQFLPVGRPNIGMPSHTQQPHFSQPMQQLPARPGQVGHILPPPPAQPIPVPDVLPNRPIISVSPQPQQTPQVPSNYMPGLGGPRLPVPSSYALSASSGGQIQINVDPTSQYQPMPQTNLPSFPAGGQPWPTVTPVQQSGEQTAVADTVPAMVPQPDPVENVRSDWIEHTARNGKRYYYNKRTKFSSWEKPLELMTPIERADASTDWREITSPDGRKYYYNKVTKQSKWIIPDELKLAREQLTKESTKGTQESSKVVNFHSPAAEAKASPPTANGSASSTREVGSSPIPVEPVATMVNPEPVVTTAGSSNLPIESSFVTTNAISVEPVVASEISVTLVNTVTTTNDSDNVSAKDVVTAADGVSAENTEEAKKGTNIGEAVNVTAVEEKTAEQEPLVYENKQEAKIAFLALLETANIGSDWTWDQSMRVIINDQRYGALKTLGERKQAFNEFLVQKKKQEVEERRVKQKKTRENFKKMLEESKELTSSSRWSKSITIFEDDERYIAVERAKDREDLFEDYILELEKKERAKAAEGHKRNRTEYIEFLKSCDFITASSQWRKVQDRLEADERCSRLEKIDRLEIFQEYLRDLEKEEEEQRKLWMEEVRRAERKNRDEFRKLMEEHVAAGTLTAKTHWRDYCMKLKELPAYLAVASNTSGATPKDLFEDVAEELQKQHLEDKDRIKDAVKLGKISVSSTWTIEDFKAAISQHIISSPPVSDINLKFVFDELQEKAREREEKEAKRRKRQADDFYEFLCSFKDITASSRWEDYKAQLEDRPEIRFNEDESFFREIFENYVTELKEKAREKERRRREEKDKEGRDREKRKQRRDKERGKGKERHRKDEPDSENDRAESHSFEDIKRSGRDKDRKHRKRHHSSFEDLSLIEDEKDIRSKNFRRHSIDRKRSKQLDQYGGGSEADYESRNKRHKRDHRNGSHRNSDHEEREFAEDGEVW